MSQALPRREGAAVLTGLLAVVLLAWGWLFLGAGLGMQQMDMGGGQIMLMAPEWTLGYAALIFLMWAIMMIHMKKIIVAYWTVHGGAISMIWPPPMSISSILSPAPVSNQTHDSAITATRPARTSVRSWRRRAPSTTGRTV